MKLTVWGKGHGANALSRELGIRMNLVNADVAIRWKRMEDYPNPQAKVLNHRNAVAAASQKYQSLVTMEECGLSVPPLSRSLQDLDRSKIIFGRDFYHTRGQDIVVIEPGTMHNVDHYYGKDYYIQYIKPKAEYRYHIAFGEVILPTKKVLADGERDDTLIRNHQDGKWRQVVCRETPEFSTACIKAVKALKLHFGAVDFLNVNGQPVILEVNTAPGLEIDNRLEAYTTAFQKFIRSL